MLDLIALIQSLTLPAGALTGARIVLDGVNGVIQIYDAGNNLVGQIDATGTFKALNPVGGYARIGVSAAQSALVLAPPPVGGHATVESALFVGDFGGAEHIQYLEIAAPSLDTKKFPRIGMHSQGLVAAAAEILMYADIPGSPSQNDINVNVTGNVLINGKKAEYAVAQTDLGGGTIGPFTAETDILSFSFTARSDATYRITFNANRGISSTVADDLARVSYTDNANNHIEEHNVSTPVANRAFPFVFIAYESGLSGTINRKIRAVRQVGTGNLTFDAAGLGTAHLAVEAVV